MKVFSIKKEQKKKQTKRTNKKPWMLFSIALSTNFTNLNPGSGKFCRCSSLNNIYRRTFSKPTRVIESRNFSHGIN